MTDRKPAGGGSKTREQRLAEALRANLRRRKAATRALRKEDAEAGKAPKSEDLPGQSGPSGRRP